MNTSTILTFPLFLGRLSYFLHGTNQTLLCVPLFFIALDLLTGILSAVKQGTFDGKHVKDIFGPNMVHYLSYLALVIVVQLVLGNDFVTSGATYFGLLLHLTSLIKSSYDNAREILSPQEMAVVDSIGKAFGQPDPGPDPRLIMIPAVPLPPLPSPSPPPPPAALTPLIPPIPL